MACKPVPFQVRFAKAAASIGTGPQGPEGPEGPPGDAGPQGPPGDGSDPTVGDPAFTGSAAPVLLQALTLATGKHYQIAFHGLNYVATASDGIRSRPFDITVCVSTLTGAAVLQSQTVGLPQPVGGSGVIGFEVSGLDIQAWVYGAVGVDSEWFGDLIKVSEYDPVVQVAGYYPTNEASCLACWDAGVGVTLVGSDVSVWSGQVGAVSATAASARPSFEATRASLNNQPVLLFDQSANEKMTVSGLASAASDYIWYAVFDQISLDADGYIFDSVTGRLVLAPDRAGGGIAYNDGSFHSGNASASTGAQYVGWILDGSGANLASIRKNGAVVGAAQSYTRVAIGGTTKLGSQNSGTTSGLFNGRLALLAGFTSVASAIRFRMEKYIQTRFAL